MGRTGKALVGAHSCGGAASRACCMPAGLPCHADSEKGAARRLDHPGASVEALTMQKPAERGHRGRLSGVGGGGPQYSVVSAASRHRSRVSSIGMTGRAGLPPEPKSGKAWCVPAPEGRGAGVRMFSFGVCQRPTLPLLASRASPRRRHRASAAQGCKILPARPHHRQCCRPGHAQAPARR